MYDAANLSDDDKIELVKILSQEQVDLDALYNFLDSKSNFTSEYPEVEFNELDRYQEEGYQNREEYLQSLADDYGIDISEVKSIANLYGPGEDFDGLLIALEDYVNSFGYTPSYDEEILDEAVMNQNVINHGGEAIDEFVKNEYLSMFQPEELNMVLPAEKVAPPSDWDSESHELNIPEGTLEQRLLDYFCEIIGDMGYSGGVKYWCSNEMLAAYGISNNLQKHLIDTIKSIVKSMFKKYKINYDITIEFDEDGCPYLYGESDANISINNRGSLNEEELWATGFTTIINNLKDGPFKSFDDLDIDCFDLEKSNPYKLPTNIPENIKSKFVDDINKYIKKGEYNN